MGKTADLTEVQNRVIDTLHKEGKPQKAIAKEDGCSQSAVSKHIHRKLNGRKRRGRKSCTSKRITTAFRGSSSKIHSRIWGELHKEWPVAPVSTSGATTHRGILDMGYKCRFPRIKSLLNQRQHQKRLTWGVERKNWTAAQWSKVLFSYESKCCMSFGNQGPRVWRKNGRMCFIKSKVNNTSPTSTQPSTRTYWGTSFFLLLTSFTELLISFSSRT